VPGLRFVAVRICAAHSTGVLDETDLLARAAAAAGTEVRGLRRLPGGVSSLTFAASAGGAPIVLKVAPPGLEPVRNRDVLRQARVIRLLGAVPGMRVPPVLFEDAGSPPFFGMKLIPGDSYEPLLDVAADPPTAKVVGARARAAARMLATMQALDPKELGVGDEPVIPVAEELDRWARLLSTVDDYICPGHERLHAGLLAGLPAPPERATLVHGDYRLANMLFTGENLEAVIDWEIWSVGDPRADLAWLLMHTDPAHRFAETRDEANTEAGRGMPTYEDLLGEYLEAGPADTSELNWFLAYCHYKTAATIAVLVKRNRRRSDPDPGLVVAGEHLSHVVEEGHRHLVSANGR
jgi:aminoglycoside phosphotransferase (APT) family kinase protein